MSTQVTTSKPINWNKVFRKTFRLSWALIVLACKLAFVVICAIAAAVGAVLSSHSDDDEYATWKEEQRERSMLGIDDYEVYK